MGFWILSGVHLAILADRSIIILQSDSLRLKLLTFQQQDIICVENVRVYYNTSIPITHSAVEATAICTELVKKSPQEMSCWLTYNIASVPKPHQLNPGSPSPTEPGVMDGACIQHSHRFFNLPQSSSVQFRWVYMASVSFGNR